MHNRILVTGGCGFIGSAFVRLLSEKALSPVVVDKLTYAGDLTRLKGVKKRFKFYKIDICDKKNIERIFKKEKPEIVVAFAAESHVDRSIKDVSSFIDTNIKGTQVLLDASMKYGIKRFVHLSTDEVYGDIRRGSFCEGFPLKPSSPYSASKAAADLLISSYVRTYNFPAIIVRPSNNYGPWQYPEKLIPLAIFKIIGKQKVPVYADGKNVREWLYVDDCARGIYQIMRRGGIGETYNLGSNEEKQNIEVVKDILRILNASDDMIGFVKDRLGHDTRYRLDSRKVFNKTGWKPRIKFNKGIKSTVNWYLQNKDWLLSKTKG